MTIINMVGGASSEEIVSNAVDEPIMIAWWGTSTYNLKSTLITQPNVTSVGWRYTKPSGTTTIVGLPHRSAITTPTYYKDISVETFEETGLTQFRYVTVPTNYISGTPTQYGPFKIFLDGVYDFIGYPIVRTAANSSTDLTSWQNYGYTRGTSSTPLKKVKGVVTMKSGTPKFTDVIYEDGSTSEKVGGVTTAGSNHTNYRPGITILEMKLRS